MMNDDLDNTRERDNRLSVMINKGAELAFGTVGPVCWGSNYKSFPELPS